ncbi:trans-sulfuration enzyme family protein [Actinokineospora pegani]|uniref:trans-sulfuration enzyme family protein n=1 Tax=Actinokineospora pegani TaxID=2654637 RepID=UPI001F2A33C0|nr:aminotransferase class V-fold PLP-dependent enzyme [Actinokineospora pegani]
MTPTEKRLATHHPDKHDPGTVGEATWAVHGGNHVDPATGALRGPLVMANCYRLPDDPATMDWSGAGELMYSRNGGFNQHALETKLAAMEGGGSAIAFASGVAALHALFFGLLRTGDHAVVSTVGYEAVWRLLGDLLPKRYGVEATFVDITDHDAVRAAVRPTTRLIHAETIANPTTAVADIPALAEIAHAAGALLTVDSTFTPPPVYRPLAHGADLVVHSLTKYINGHGDAMGGAIIGSHVLLDPIRADALVDVGATLSPFNAWLIMRGSVTLPLRMRQQQATAHAVAHYLAADPRIAFTAYPGLAGHPHHALAQRQFQGNGGVLSFALDGPPDLQNSFVSALRVITSAVSLGHDETLIVHVGTDGRAGTEHYPAVFREYGHLRLSVGLEEPEDIIADLATALDKVMP